MNISIPKYKPEKTKAFKNLEALHNGQALIPKWVIVLGSCVLAASVIVFVASIAISATRKPNGLYNQSCSNRNCETKLGLKCIDKVCLCPVNQFYLDKCNNLSSFGDICIKNENCIRDHNLICGITSKCACEPEKYWNLNLKKCLPKKTHSETCNGDECKSGFNLICESGICVCLNKKRNYWNGTMCSEKKKHDENCMKTDECLDSEETVCLNSKCSCSTSKYFELSDTKCVSKVGEFVPCSNDTMCLSPMFCSEIDGCRCQGYKYFENSTLSCINQKLINRMCSRDNECRQDLGLTCINNFCACSFPKFIWSPTSQKCKLTYAKSVCTQDLDCNESEGLVCRLSGECNCPTASSISMCDCVRTLTNEQYWNGSKCAEAHTFKSKCSENYHCRTQLENTICIDSKCDCIDRSEYFWNGQKCEPKKTFNQSCNANIQCLDAESTICINSICQCGVNEYFGLSKCRLKMNEFQPCSSDNMCFSPMTCVSNQCLCGTNEYFENRTLSCLPKLINGFSCNRDFECRSDLKLECKDNKCVCNSLNYEWSHQSQNCLITYSKGYCLTDNDCNPEQKLICQPHTVKNCSCPLISLPWICDCMRENNNENYWNGKECTQTQTFGKNCSENYHCQTITQNTVCNNNICKCENNLRYVK